ncbi:unnamed protein product [Caenorhabditis auriculariae]|uniref:Uncharacterized protein n=1 Tax=Caenorhabditis auriculariae TaxID=2777116 RepID=A0A8S1GW96_9PELO|nr:unnamed protein product [Caenorhabditis auriculariae]
MEPSVEYDKWLGGVSVDDPSRPSISVSLGVGCRLHSARRVICERMAALGSAGKHLLLIRSLREALPQCRSELRGNGVLWVDIGLDPGPGREDLWILVL